MRIKHFLKIILYLFLFSCSESENTPVKCETYYLYSIGSSEAHYNEDGLISEYISGTDTTAKFEYNDDKQLKSIKNQWVNIYYHYDEAKKLKYLLEYYNGNFRDSITFVFNPEGLISTIKHHTPREFSIQLTMLIEHEYVGKNSIEAKYYV